jgi:hypothetical protein
LATFVFEKYLSFLARKQRNRILKDDVDRLLEQALEAEIMSVIKDELYQTGTNKLMEKLCVENIELNVDIEKLKHENNILRMNNDDVCKQFSKESFQLKQTLDLYEAQSIEMELQLQSHKISDSCQLCKNLESFKSLCLKYEKELRS